MNKPKGFLTTVSDDRGRKTVMELLKGKVEERIFPVGRLDRATTGLLLLTNDGDLAKTLSHPSHKVKKVYHVVLDKPLAKVDLEKIRNGLELEDGLAPVDGVDYVKDTSKNEVGIELHIGRNRIVRRIFEHLGYEVVRLDRVYYAGLTKKDLPRGFFRDLTEKEVIMLKHFTK
jgi:23S rRNA pseudouridine2605 synthase